MAMSQPGWSRITADTGTKILAFPTVGESQAAPQSELGAGLSYASPENLIIEATHVLERVVRLAGSLNDSQRIDVLGHLLCLETQILDPLQAFVERHRTFLSDLSARQAKKRRRRQKRARQDIKQIA